MIALRGVAELVDAPDLKSVGHCGHAGSSPATPTNQTNPKRLDFFFFAHIIKNTNVTWMVSLRKTGTPSVVPLARRVPGQGIGSTTNWRNSHEQEADHYCFP